VSGVVPGERVGGGAEAPILELRGITKRFPGVLANDRIDLELYRGEVLALLGENGAGKSTLMNVLYGLYRADEGTIRLDGREIAIRSARDAIGHGIGMVHQHFMLVPTMSVLENLALGHEPRRRRVFLDRGRVARDLAELSRRFALDVDPTALVGELPVGVQQRVEILKALYRGARILILDEPTAVLTPQERDELFAIIRAMITGGKSVIFISHKLKEVLEIADRVAVLRLGRLSGVVRRGEASELDLARMMVGREVALSVEKSAATPGAEVLRLRGIFLEEPGRPPLLEGISLGVRSGEVVGIAGVQGNGQTELVRVIAGLLRPTAGSVELAGREITLASPRERLSLGLGHIPEDRQRQGLVLTHSIAENLVLSTYRRAPFCRRGLLREGAIRAFATRLLARFDIRAPGIDTPAGKLSGGNQQKVVVARELGREIRLLLAVQPTRGLDVGSIEFIHRRILEQRAQGCGVLLVSTELDEILALSDRILVMFGGRIVGRFDAAEVSRERLGLLMGGAA
jgi:simple sugar transport system ATP-binding protein